MGFIRKITGVQAQIDAAKQNAAAQEKATKQAADAQSESLMSAAKAAADQQSMLAARRVVENKAADLASTPLATADVQLDQSPTESVTARRAKRKATYGRSYSSGVSI
jgi:hypothetical protein